MPKHAMVSAEAFCLFTKGAKLYTLEVSKLTKKTIDEQIPVVYKDLHKAFSKEASNELPDPRILDMKIEFKRG